MENINKSFLYNLQNTQKNLLLRLLKKFVLILLALFMSACTMGPTGWNYWYNDTMKKQAREKGYIYHVVYFSTIADLPYMGSSKESFKKAEKTAKDFCEKRGNKDCYLY